MTKILIIFIFISSCVFSQTNMFWNNIDLTFIEIIDKLGTPNGFEYQNDGSYWIAYDYGHRSVVYVIDKAVVTSILYLEHTDSYDFTKKSFINWDEVSREEGFIDVKKEIRFLQKKKEYIFLQAKLVENFNSFLIAIEIKRLQ